MYGGSNVSDVLQQYRKAADPIPGEMQAWQVYGAGMENVGRDGHPESIPVPEPGPGEILVRIDANGLCFSDIKIIKQGETHPRIRGRNLRLEPIIIGHETAMTVVTVGQGLEGRFRVGDRFIVQADVFYHGTGLAFGYVLPGGLEQYCLVGKEILDGDEGCYLLPLKPETGYAEAALTEPWACVEASYRVGHRANVKDGGSMLLYRSGGAKLGDYQYEGLGRSARVLVNDAADSSAEKARLSATTHGIDYISIADDPDWDAILQQHTGGERFDDAIFLGTPTPEVFEAIAARMNKNGMLCVISDTPLARPVSIDVGRVHYENIVYAGTTSKKVVDAYTTRGTELTPGGWTWIVGAGGPMGQMHLQRAVEDPHGPSTIVATDLDLTRLQTLKDRFSKGAEARGVSLHLFNPNAMEKGDFDAQVERITGGKGFDEVCVMVPVPAVISDASRFLGSGGGMNIFAGVGIGTMAVLDLSGVWQKRQRYWGSSGSSIADLRVMLEKTETHQVITNNSVAAIGGMNAARDGLQGLTEARFPGKTVIFPQFPDLPLTALTDLHNVLPNVAAKLQDGKFWCKDAEEELLRTYLSREAGQPDAA